MKFKLGDRVKGEEFGKGTVIGFSYNGSILVEYDKFMKGHNGLGKLAKGKAGKNGHCWYEGSSKLIKINDKMHFKSLPSNYSGTIEVENGFIQEKEILDEVEKEYLLNVIRPFRSKVISVTKADVFLSEFIKIRVKNEPPICLPFFGQGTMYKDMELDKEYSLKELGLNV